MNLRFLQSLRHFLAKMPPPFTQGRHSNCKPLARTIKYNDQKSFVNTLSVMPRHDSSPRGRGFGNSTATAIHERYGAQKRITFPKGEGKRANTVRPYGGNGNPHGCAQKSDAQKRKGSLVQRELRRKAVRDCLSSNFAIYNPSVMPRHATSLYTREA